MRAIGRRSGARLLPLAALLLAAGACTKPPAGPDGPTPGAPADETGPGWFRDVTAEPGVRFAYRNGEEADQYTILEALGGGLAAFDFDGDGPADPAKGRRFVDVTATAGLPRGLWTTGAAWGDLDGDGYPDLYVCQYGDWSFERNHPTDCRADDGRREICMPKRFAGLEHRVFR